MPTQDTEAKGTTLREFATRFVEACGQAREQNSPARTRVCRTATARKRCRGIRFGDFSLGIAICPAASTLERSDHDQGSRG